MGVLAAKLIRQAKTGILGECRLGNKRTKRFFFQVLMSALKKPPVRSREGYIWGCG
jgi:hypothetical protein